MFISVIKKAYHAILCDATAFIEFGKGDWKMEKGTVTIN